MQKLKLTLGALFISALAFSANVDQPQISCPQFLEHKPMVAEELAKGVGEFAAKVNDFCSLPGNEDQAYEMNRLEGAFSPAVPGGISGTPGQPGYCGLVQMGCKMYWWWSPIAADLCVKFYGC